MGGCTVILECETSIGDNVLFLADFYLFVYSNLHLSQVIPGKRSLHPICRRIKQFEIPSVLCTLEAAETMASYVGAVVFITVLDTCPSDFFVTPQSPLLSLLSLLILLRSKSHQQSICNGDSINQASTLS